MAITGFDLNTLVSYYTARSFANLAAQTPLPSGVSTQSSSTAQTPPWNQATPTDEKKDSIAFSSDDYFDSTDLNLKSATTTSTSSGSLIEALMSSRLSSSSTSTTNTGLTKDNDKLFALYNALTRLDYISQIASRDDTVSGQLPGLNTRFQSGLSQILSFLGNTAFANLSVLAGKKTDTVTGTAIVPTAPYTYAGATVAKDAAVLQPLTGVTTSDSFTISVTKSGVTTDVDIDLSKVQGSLTMDHIAAYANQQLAAQGFTTRLQRTQTGGSVADGTATWGFSITNMGAEKVSFSSSAAKAALYIAGTAGDTADASGKLIKLTDLDTDPTSVYSRSITPDGASSTVTTTAATLVSSSTASVSAATNSNTASAKASVVDADGNVYIVGNTNGDFAGELNQSTGDDSHDVFLTKYDSAGNALWTKLLGSASSASAYGLALAPDGGVVVAGSTTSDLTTSSIGGGTDSFVAKYNAQGDQSWVRQIAPVANDSAFAVTVASDGSIYVGGQVNGKITASQTNAGGADAYVTKLDSKGNAIYSRQFGTAGTDSTSSMAIASDGNLVVASVQDGHAIVTKYNSSDGTGAALWQMDLGDLQSGGSLGQLAVDGDQIYLSGTTQNASLDAGGSASVATTSSGGLDAFVFNLTDNGDSASANHISYVGTGSTDRGAGLVVSGGKVYLTGTTSGTFDGQTRSAQNTNNLFVVQLDASGSIDWARQYGGIDGQSQGAGIAVDTQGSSVLDALGLPRGTINNTQSSELASNTTVRTGDYFTMKITDATGTRTVKISIDKGETMRSLALKISNRLLSDGKATSSYASGGHALKISVNQGVSVTLEAGDGDFDALKGLGIKPGLLINDTTDDASTSTADTSKTDTSSTQTVGLGIDGVFSLLSTSDILHAHNTLQGALSLIKKAYQTLNTPASSTKTTDTSGTVPGYLTAQLASYQNAASLFGTSTSDAITNIQSIIQQNGSPVTY